MADEGAWVEVRMRFTLPATATVEQIDQWLRFELGERHTMLSANPLRAHDVQADWLEWDFTDDTK